MPLLECGNTAWATPHQSKWNAIKLLGGINPAHIKLKRNQIDSMEEAFWNFLSSEYDARHFYARLMEQPNNFSDDFHVFANKWSQDEANHTEGFLMIYRIFYPSRQEDINCRMKQRKVDFSRLNEFFYDEFKLCLLLAYDELATTHAYHRDYPFYKSLGPRELFQFIQLVTSDEASHFNNLIRLIKKKHAHRFPEVLPVMEHIFDLDLNGGEYLGTFVLDHAGAGYGLTVEDLKTLCFDRIIRMLG